MQGGLGLLWPPVVSRVDWKLMPCGSRRITVLKDLPTGSIHESGLSNKAARSKPGKRLREPEPLLCRTIALRRNIKQMEISAALASANKQQRDFLTLTWNQSIKMLIAGALLSALNRL